MSTPCQGRAVVGCGAAGARNALLNRCGIRAALLNLTVDRRQHKHSLSLPGTHVPAREPERIAESKTNLVVVRPWSLWTWISEQLDYIRSWGGRVVFPIPALKIV